jgi:hypothetical protein
MTGHDETSRCVNCSTTAAPGAPATVCDECVRAIALKWWGAIARHGTDSDHKCELCEIGHPGYCGDCAVDAVQAHRACLRETGHPIQGEPPFVFVADRELTG